MLLVGVDNVNLVGWWHTPLLIDLSYSRVEILDFLVGLDMCTKYESAVAVPEKFHIEEGEWSPVAIFVCPNLALVPILPFVPLGFKIPHVN